ncbi:MAG TPA: hypothetical protein VGH79_03500 [Gaiellaceae bacterium]
MKHAVSLSALLAVSLSVAACGGASAAQDAGYFDSHFANPRVHSCLTRGKHVFGEKQTGAAMQGGYWTEPALHGVVLCMQRRLAGK